MTKAHQRKKAPQEVRRAILNCAARMAVENGIKSLSVQAVASEAGVTKGGLFHHFPSKKILIKALCTDLLQSVDDLIDPYLTKGYGNFTRAYVQATLTPLVSSNPFTSLSLTLLSDPMLRILWNDWLRGRLEYHKETDDCIDLEIIRYAADGIWLAELMQGVSHTAKERIVLRDKLLDFIGGE